MSSRRAKKKTITRRHKVSLRRYADGISFGEAMEEVVRLGALSLENAALDKSEILSNDGERYWKV